MKLSVIEWTMVQNECFTDEPDSETFRDHDHRFLCDLIEDRTRGKQYQQKVAINLRHTLYGNLEAIAAAALERGRNRVTATRSARSNQSPPS